MKHTHATLMLLFLRTVECLIPTVIRRPEPLHSCRRTAVIHANAAVELQQDCGRGLEHLSARIEEGDVCVYQVGTWHVDWSEVGSGDPPRLLLVRADVLQLNWAGDHEHGRIIATAITDTDSDDAESISAVSIAENEPFAGVEFGPEQLIARVPAEWVDEFTGRLLAPLPAILPASLVGEEQWLEIETGRFMGPGLG